MYIFNLGIKYRMVLFLLESFTAKYCFSFSIPSFTFSASSSCINAPHSPFSFQKYIVDFVSLGQKFSLDQGYNRHLSNL
jgi:hypothetical protein